MRERRQHLFTGQACLVNGFQLLNDMSLVQVAPDTLFGNRVRYHEGRHGLRRR